MIDKILDCETLGTGPLVGISALIGVALGLVLISAVFIGG